MAQDKKTNELGKSIENEPILSTIERWMHFFCEDIPGDRVSLDEWIKLNDEIVYWRDMNAPQIEVDVLVKLKSRLLRDDVLCVGVIRSGMWPPSEEDISVTIGVALAQCDRIKRFAERSSGAGTGQQDSTKKRQAKKPGRPVVADRAKDERIYSMWESKAYRSYEELGQELHMNRKEVLRALDRHRKFKARATVTE